MRIPWTFHLTNDEVLRSGVEKQLLKTVKQPKIYYLGHMLKGSGLDTLLYYYTTLILQGKLRKTVELVENIGRLNYI